jgi:VIT1/CCC1 family predicted Fe2+/Mn2+ transporter
LRAKEEEELRLLNEQKAKKAEEKKQRKEQKRLNKEKERLASMLLAHFLSCSFTGFFFFLGSVFLLTIRS